MLPGFVAGYYTFDECHVDLLRLCSLCGVQFVHATAKNIDPEVGRHQSILYTFQDFMTPDKSVTLPENLNHRPNQFDL